MKNLNSKSGITMIALVVTIIVLIILAGVTLAMTVGDNGIINKATEAKDSDAYVAVREKIQLAIIAKEREVAIKGRDITQQDIRDVLGEEGDIVEEWETVVGVTTPKGYVALEDVWGGKFSKPTAVDINRLVGSSIKIGDYVAYIPTSNTFNWATTENGISYSTYSGLATINTGTITTENLQWRVLDIKDGKVRLICYTQPSAKIKFASADGYNNGVYLLDKICNTLYSSPKGVAKNLKIEDIQEKMNLEYWDYHGSIGYSNEPRHGETKTYTTDRYYPNIAALERDISINGARGTRYSQSEQEELITGVTRASSSLETTHSFWKNPVANKFNEPYFKDAIYYTLLIESNASTTWLSSRCVRAFEYACYEIASVSKYNIDSASQYVSWNAGGSAGDDRTYRIKPVVTLNTNIQVDLTAEGKDGSTPEKAWVLK